MKTEYFKSESIEKKTAEMLAEIKRRIHVHYIPFTAEKSALLILDMQIYFLGQGSHAFIPASSAIIPGLKSLISAFRSKNQPVIFTKHIDSGDPDDSMARWWKGSIEKDSEYSGICDKLDTAGCRIFEKSQYDAFYGTPLEEFLRETHIRQVVICGLMTHLCCETTARSAFMRGFDVFFTIDGTATYNEDFHMAALLNLSHGFAVPVTVGEIINQVKSDAEN